MRVEYTAASLLNDDHQHKIEAAQAFCEKRNWIFGIQVHNTTPSGWIDHLYSLGVPLSFHAPVNSKYFINLANRDDSFARQSLAQTAEIIRQYQGDLAVFHGFLMTDKPIRIFNAERRYDDCLAPAYREEISQPGYKLCRDFLQSSEYLERLERLKQRLATISIDYPGITWCIENDFPLYGAGLLLAEAIQELQSPLCLDVSHLWASCLLLGRDFPGQVEAIAQTGRVGCVHLHANPITSETPLEQFRDGHMSLATPNAMDLPAISRILWEHQARHWVIETGQADLIDLQLLAEWLKQ